MSSSNDHSGSFNTSVIPIRFERLEERLLLTTLHGGDFFIYQNSHEENVRIDLIGDPTDTVELMSLWDVDLVWDYELGFVDEVVDLVGLLNPDDYWGPEPYDPLGDPQDDPSIINWPELVDFPYVPEVIDPVTGEITEEAVYGSRIIEFDNQGRPVWVDYNENNPALRGAATEIFSVYVGQCSPDTYITISTLQPDQLYPTSGNNGLHFTNVNPWEGERPFLFRRGNNNIRPPTGSGGVLAGGVHRPIGNNFIRYEAGFGSAIVEPEGVLVEPGKPTGILANEEVVFGVTVSDKRDPYTLEIVPDPGTGEPIAQEMGRIIIAGMVSNEIYATGSVETIRLGFLWGNITVEHNIGDILLRRGGGGLVDQQNVRQPGWPYEDIGSLIHAGGTLDMVMMDARDDANGSIQDGLTFYSAVEALNHPTIGYTDTVLYELEYKAYDYRNRWQTDYVLDEYWRQGLLVDYDNDIIERAQFLNYPTGNFTLDGESIRYRTSETGWTSDTDWYALPLMAGQTVTIGGEISGDIAVHFYGPGDYVGVEEQEEERIRWRETFGYETEEDWGIASRPSYFSGTPKPITFTAPAAGVYYLEISDWGGNDDIFSGTYHLEFTNGPHAALGAVDVVGNYRSVYYGGGPAAGGANFATTYGGDLGAVVIFGDSELTSVRAIGGGDIVCFQAEEIGAIRTNSYTTNAIISDGNIGRVASTAGFLDADIEAGASDGFYNNDAYIQNVYAATHFIYGFESDYYNYGGTIIASGSIGVIEVGQHIGYSVNSAARGAVIRANSDGVGPGGHVDLIHVGGDYCYVLLYHGPGGDIGYIHVDGTIYVQWGSWSGPLQETVITYGPDDPNYGPLNDDGGGQLTIKPARLTDEYGIPQFDDENNPLYHTYAYSIIPVDDYIGGVGGVITNLRIEGSAEIIATNGLTQISNLNVIPIVPETGAGQEGVEPDIEITINGNAGRADIYYLDGLDHRTPPQPQIRWTDIDSFTNNTLGELICGTLGSANSIHLAGDLGQMDSGSTRAWLFGYEDAPIISESRQQSPNIYFDEPQYGWFHDRINGFNFAIDPDSPGDLDELSVDGVLGDLRVEGRLGIVKVNADGISGAYWDDWDGVNGIVWAQTRIDDIDVGDGLADDGGGGMLKAAILSTMSIGEVSISGNRYERSPLPDPRPDDPWQNLSPLDKLKRNESLKRAMVFGELNGSIFGHSNDTIQVTRVIITRDSYGNIISQRTITTTGQVDAIGEVVGEGSTLTAIVGGAELDSFRCFKYQDYRITGTVGQVSFSGAGAELYGSEIFGTYVRDVITSADSAGISYCYISGDSSVGGEYRIGHVVAGGPGMSYSELSANGGDIGVVETAGDVADIIYSTFGSTDGMKSISARNLYYNGFNMPGTLELVSATQEISYNNSTIPVGTYMHPGGFRVGEIGKMTAGGDFTDNELIVAGIVESIEVGGYFDSVLTLQGPTTAYLKSLVVAGANEAGIGIAGTITCAGHIGSIISRTGKITADISTLAGGWNNDVELIQTAKGYSGKLDVAGSLVRFISYSSLGNEPAEDGGTGTVFDIFGDLGYLGVKGTIYTPSDLFADVNVGGNIGTIDVDGTLYANLTTNGDLNKLYLDGSLGAELTFEEDWVGDDGDLWSASWIFEGDTGQLAHYDIQDGHGRVMGQSGSTGTVIAYVNTNGRDVDQTVLFNISGEDMAFGLVARRLDENPDTYYLARVVCGAESGSSLRIYKVVDGVMIELADTGLLYDTPGTDYRMQFSCQTNGSETDLKVRMWDASDTRPADWDAEVTDYESSLQSVSGRFGLYYELYDELFIETDKYTATYPRGSVTAFGSLKRLKFNTSEDLIADITVGSSIKKLSMKGGSILGNIKSLFGSVSSVSVQNGNIVGDLTGVSIGKVYVTNGNIAGDIKATNGNIKSVTVKNGDLEGDLTAENGRIDSVRIYYGNASGSSTITADGGIGKVYVKEGNLAADITSERDIKYVYVKGGNLTGELCAETGIGKIIVYGTIYHTAVRCGGAINYVAATYLNGAIISSAQYIGTVKVTANVIDSLLLAGYDVGADGEIGGGDDNPLTGGKVHSGNIKYISIIGRLDGSIVAAGIGPGADADYLTVTDNVEADGTSSIRRMIVKGGFGANPATNGVLADTSIDGGFASQAGAAGVVVYYGVSRELDGGAGTIDFGPGTANGNTLTTLDGLTLTLSSGRANYKASTGELLLEETSSRSSLTLKYDGAATYDKIITIESSDDSGLSSLKVIGNITLGDISIDGSVGTLQASNAEAGSEWLLPGGVKSAKLGSLTDVDITAGEIGKLYIDGNYASGVLDAGILTADAIKSLYVKGQMSGEMTTILGDASKIYIGNLDGDGDINVRGSIKSLVTSGSLNGNVEVSNGDLSSLKVTGTLDGDVNVERGWTKSVTVSYGNFSGSYSALGIKSFKVSRGHFSTTGVISAQGNLDKLSVSNGTIYGRVWAGGSIKSMTVAGMYGALVAASGDFTKATIKYNMTDSFIFAGFNPGDGSISDGNSEGGTIKSVYIGGNMVRSTISGAVAPGDDGYVGTDDDMIAGTGYVYSVKVAGYIQGSGISDESYGVFAANNMPKVTAHGQPFLQFGNARVEDMSSAAGYMEVIDFRITSTSVIVTFDHPLDFSTVEESTFTLLASTDPNFVINVTDISAGVPNVVTYDSDDYSVTLRLIGNTWETLEQSLYPTGDTVYYQLTIDGTAVDDGRAVTDIRGNDLGKDFVRVLILGDLPDTFEEAAVALLPLVVDGDTFQLRSTFETDIDIDIIGFSANAFNYFSAELSANTLAEMALFYRDDQGTAWSIWDDSFEAVARWEYMQLSTDNIFEAFELPETGEYYLVMTPSRLTWWPEAGSYQVEMTLSSGDLQLIANLGGLPLGEQIAYVSNEVGDNNNSVGANDPKQLVYLDFDGGTTTEYEPWQNLTVDALDLSIIDWTLAGYESALINGDVGMGVAGIVENIISIYQNTPDSYTSEAYPSGKKLTVNEFDPSDPIDWNDYLNATEGLWFTTVDPATAQGLDPETNFTTVFIGEANDWVFGGSLLGIASDIDLANLSEADNALVFAQNFAGFYSAATVADRLNGYSFALANVTAHELGHILGLNHQPTDGFYYWLLPDDPDNNPITPDDSNTGTGLMAYAPVYEYVAGRSELGTAPLTSNEFPIGNIDTADLLLRWLA